MKLESDLSAGQSYSDSSTITLRLVRSMSFLEGEAVGEAVGDDFEIGLDFELAGFFCIFFPLADCLLQLECILEVCPPRAVDLANTLPHTLQACSFSFLLEPNTATSTPHFSLTASPIVRASSSQSPNSLSTLQPLSASQSNKKSRQTLLLLPSLGQVSLRYRPGSNCMLYFRVAFFASSEEERVNFWTVKVEDCLEVIWECFVNKMRQFLSNQCVFLIWGLFMKWAIFYGGRLKSLRGPQQSRLNRTIVNIIAKFEV